MSDNTPPTPVLHRFDAAAHRPKSQRLRLGVRGAAGTGKSTFAASLAEAGLGRLCFFDTELKSCHIPGSDGSRFDAFEIADPNDLAAAISWALHEDEGQAQQYGSFVLDSWNGWFGPTYAHFLQAKRVTTGVPFPELDSDDLQRLQVVAGEILRRLCIDTHACVVITDTIAGKGLEQREDYEVGRIVPISASGLEYAVDVLVEAELRLASDGITQLYVHRVIKSNTRAFPIGLVLESPCFQDYLDRLNAPHVATAQTIRAESSAAAAAAPVAEEPSLESRRQALRDKAAAHGFNEAELVTAATYYCGKSNLNALTPAEIAELDRRLDKAKKPTVATSRPDVPQGAASAGMATAAPQAAGADAANGARGRSTQRP
jgi:hypothetical protein